MTIMAMARAHIAGEHAGDRRDPKCALCPACEACGGKGVVAKGVINERLPVRCEPCKGTGSQKGGRG